MKEMIKVAGLTPCWNEEATIVFCVGSLLPYVDHYVVVDSGSTDKTVTLLKKVFSKEIESGKLIIIEYGPLPDFDISKPKNAAIQKIKELGCERFIRLDADDVFYDSAAKNAVHVAKNLAPDITLYTINHWELYQNKANTTLDWLNQITSPPQKPYSPSNILFWCLRMPPGADPSINSYPHRFDGSYGHARIYKTDGAVSIGKWTDEALGLGPGEDIHHPGLTRNCKGDHDEGIVHYGWARPMNKKLAKGKIWSGENKERADPRVDGIEKQWKNILSTSDISRIAYGMAYWPNYIIFPFTKHPEVFNKYINEVKECFQ